MWKRSCRWPVVCKGLISAAFVAIIVAILAIPSPDRVTKTRVEIVGAEKSASIMGPEAPAGYHMDDYLVSEGGANLLAADDALVDNTIYVYGSAQKGSNYYHDPQCQYAYATAKRMTLYEAYMLGYTTPCGICNPPLYDLETGTVLENPAAAVTAAPNR